MHVCAPCRLSSERAARGAKVGARSISVTASARVYDMTARDARFAARNEAQRGATQTLPPGGRSVPLAAARSLPPEGRAGQVAGLQRENFY